MDKKRSTVLTVFCILSWVWMAITLFGVFTSFTSGPPTDEELKEAQMQMLEGQTEETLEVMGWMLEELMDISIVQQQNFTLINSLALVQILIGGLGVFLMFSLRKLGFHLYLIYSIIPLTLSSWLYGSFKVGIAGIIFSAVISIIFIIVYSRQLKHME